MRQKNTTHKLFKSGRPFYYRGIFSGSFTKKMGSTLNSYYSFSEERKEIPSLTGIPKRNLHLILHYLALELIKKSKQPSSSSSFSQKRHRYFLFQYHKNFQLVSRLKGTALCLLQTQYAKKPRNPE